MSAQRRMFRYEVPVDDQPHRIALTSAPRAVAFGLAGMRAYVEFWAEHTDQAPEVTWTFQVYGTGHALPDDAEWVGTCPRDENGLVFHLYRIGQVEW